METINLAKTEVKTNTPTVAMPSDKAVSQPIGVETSGKLLPNSAEGDLTSQPLASYGSTKEIETTVKVLNNYIQNIQRGIEFSIHEETGREFVIVTDKSTGEEIRQFPSDEVLAISAKVAEMLAVPEERALGLFISKTA